MITAIADNSIPDVDDASFIRRCLLAFAPRPRQRTLEWCKQNIVTNAGNAYDHLAFPHLGNPGGIFDAFDDPHVRTITEQIASRLGKTFAPKCCMIKTAMTDPAPMMIASESQPSCKRVMARAYDMIRKQPKLRAELLYQAEADQRQDLIKWKSCQCVGAWGTSEGTLSDEDIKVGLANEYDKKGWKQKSTSTEAEPSKLFDDRFKKWWSTRKQFFDSTPSVKGQSRIERRRLAGWNCSYNVPCPHCKRYQVLEFGTKDTKHGIKWQPLEDGRHTEDQARATGVYVCRHCEESIEDHWRPWMMRRGVWCPEGCTVVDEIALMITEQSLEGNYQAWEWSGWANAEWVEGKPLNDGVNASYQLSSLYALSLSWGDIAAEFVKCRDKPSELRNFWNGWLALTWEIKKRKATWEEVGERVIVDMPRGIVPDGYSLLTIGIDKQEYFYVYVVLSWNQTKNCHVVAYGIAETTDEIRDIITAKWEHEDGDKPIVASMSLIDSGYRPADVHEFVSTCAQRRIPIVACRGSSTPINGFYRQDKNSSKTSNPGRWVIRVDHFATNDWLDKRLYDLTPDDEGGLSVFSGSRWDHCDFLQQAIGEAPDESERWVPIDENDPVDYRDCLRYGMVAMLFKTRHGRIKHRYETTGKTSGKRQPARRRKTSGPISPWGRAFFQPYRR